MHQPVVVLGKVRDIEPNGKSCRWEIYFDRSLEGVLFPAKHESAIDVEWPSGVFRTLVGIKPGNPIYLRTAAVSSDGATRTRVTDLCERHGFGRTGPIAFEVVIPGQRYRVCGRGQATNPAVVA